MKEIWKDIPGFENLYQVSNLGRINGVKRNKVLKPRKQSNGYSIYNLSNGGEQKNYFGHRLVADSFIPNLENKPYVNHKNGIKNDNRLENLEWVTGSENSIHSYAIGLQKPMKKEKHPLYGKKGKLSKSSKVVLQYDLQGNLISKYFGTYEAKRKTGISQASINACCNSKQYRKTAGNFIWKYE